MKSESQKLPVDWILLKGALEKYNIHLLVSNPIEDFKSNQYQNFQLILPMHFHFIGTLWTASSSECPIGYCIVPGGPLEYQGGIRLVQKFT